MRLSLTIALRGDFSGVNFCFIEMPAVSAKGGLMMGTKKGVNSLQPAKESQI
jgi:hypothetical protein